MAFPEMRLRPQEPAHTFGFMKRYLFPLLAAFVVLVSPGVAYAADAKAQLDELVKKVQGKLKSGANTEQALAEELKGFDALVAEHKGEKTDDVAQIVFMKALLYMQVLDDQAKATALFKQLETDFPGTAPAKRAPQVLEANARQAEANKKKAGLKPGAAFPNFEEKDLDGKPLSVAGMKGKVTLIDFWATWCGPCIAELPNVTKAYEKYHSQGFEIIGISLDQDREKLTSFIKAKNMTWPQYFDGKGWQNKLAAQYGINSIPATYLLDKEGKILATGLRGEALEEAVGKALK
jgi:thiol-disulfide isomerase/thioredoxin